MGTREVTRKESGAAQSRIIILLIVCVHLVTSQRSGDEAATPSPPKLPYSSLNSCPDHLTITQILDALTCTLQSVPPLPPWHDGGDLNSVADMMGDQELRTATFAGAVVTALSASRKDEALQWEIMFILIFPAAVCALFFCEIPMRNLCPRFAQVLEQLLIILFVNALIAFLLPAEWFWVPGVCFASSLLTLIIAPWLP